MTRSCIFEIILFFLERTLLILPPREASSFEISSLLLHFCFASSSPVASPLSIAASSSSSGLRLLPRCCDLFFSRQELTIEEHREWREMTNMMQNVAAPPEALFQTVHARDQIFDEVNKVYAIKWKDVLDSV
ncbi:hypothetical protein GmHk_20G059111 [Glycine max]|nr:hypothetical protein GmHk_20G059111 [Glycine max]